MVKWWLASACSAMLLVAGCNKPAPNAGQETIQGQSMARMLATVDTIRDYTQGKTTLAAANQAATELLSWSDRLGELFPPEVAPSQYVDLTPEMARNAPLIMHEQAASLAAAVASGSVGSATAALASTEKNGCGFCHLTPYRQ